MLHESIWSALARDATSPFRAAMALKRGRAALKRYLVGAADIDVTSLPYDPGVIERIRAWKAEGGRTALVTASDETYARAIADHLDLFDEVHGSDGVRNLKGEGKAAFLQERFGAAGFAYMGDAEADLPVWSRAAKAITVNAPARLRHAAEQSCADVDHLVTRTPTARPYVLALRPHQWMKNLLVFLPMLAAHRLDAATVLTAILAFVCFSLVASSVYLLNDLLDLSADRAHPRKCKRPFASGSVPIAHGTLMAIGLFLGGCAIGLWVGPGFLLVMLGYFALTLGYSLHLKRRMVLDICVLAALYTVRIVAGGVATGLSLSVWLLAFSVFFFLSLAAVKRQAELMDAASRGKLTAAGRGYHVDDLPIIAMIGVAGGYIAVLVMALYVNSPDVTKLYAIPEMLWGVCAILLYWITRTVMVAHRGQMHDDPVVYAARDRISQICFLLILVFAVAGALQ